MSQRLVNDYFRIGQRIISQALLKFFKVKSKSLLSYETISKSPHSLYAPLYSVLIAIRLKTTRLHTLFSMVYVKKTKWLRFVFLN